jgi:hypothetical protein
VGAARRSSSILLVPSTISTFRIFRDPVGWKRHPLFLGSDPVLFFFILSLVSGPKL